MVPLNEVIARPLVQQSLATPNEAELAAGGKGDEAGPLGEYFNFMGEGTWDRRVQAAGTPPSPEAHVTHYLPWLPVGSHG